MDLVIVRAFPPRLPRGYSSVLIACVYIAEFRQNNKESLRQKVAIYQLASALESATANSSLGNKPLIIIAGDFNGASTKYLCDSLQLYLINKSATRGKNTLDLVLTNAPKCYNPSNWPALGESDHMIVLCKPSQSLYKACIPATVKIMARTGKVADTVHQLRTTDWSPVISNLRGDPQEAINLFYSSILEAENTWQPLKVLKLKNDKPWMTREIKKLIAKRQRYYKAGSVVMWKATSNKVVHLINAAKKAYFNKNYTIGNPNWWKEVNSIRAPAVPFSESDELANSLNDGFYTVWNGTKQPDISKFVAQFPYTSCPKIFNPGQLCSLMKMMTSGPGPDGLASKLLKCARFELSELIARIFNHYLSISFVPAQWKQANITPIAKIDHPSSWSDYRPISITSNLCKLFERVLARYIINKTSSIWRSNNQNGFLPGKSTMGAISKVIFDWGLALDAKDPIVAIFFDFAKAFDLVQHDLLLSKLEKTLEPFLVSWIAAYLTGRQQRVKIKNTTTPWQNVEAGVIQGSVLGPVLFIIFISDINSFIPAGVNTEKYADDILSYITGDSADSSLPQAIVDGVQRWCAANQMRLNTSKCKCLINPGKSTRVLPPLLLNGETLEVVTSYKYLGIELSKNLDWSLQWDRVKSNISRLPFLLKLLKRTGFNQKIVTSAYISLGLSLLTYSCVALSSAQKQIKSEIASVHSRCLRIIGIEDIKTSTSFIRDINVYIEECSFKQISKILNDPDHPLFIHLSRTAHYKTRSSFQLNIPRAKTEAFNQNPVMVALRKLRDQSEIKIQINQSIAIQIPSRSHHQPALPQTQQTRQRDQVCPGCGNQFARLSSHLRFCRGR